MKERTEPFYMNEMGEWLEYVLRDLLAQGKTPEQLGIKIKQEDEKG